MSKTFVNQVPPATGRKYNIVSNGDGTSSITDVTVYLQDGTPFTADDANQTMRKEDFLNTAGDALDITKGGTGANTAQEARTNLGAAAETVEITGTLTAAGWVGASAPYTQEVAMSGVTATAKGVVGLSKTASAPQREAARNAAMQLTLQTANSITVTADGTKPTVDLPIVLHLLG